MALFDKNLLKSCKCLTVCTFAAGKTPAEPVGVPSAGAISFTASVSGLNTKEWFSKLKTRYTRRPECKKLTLFLNEETLKKPMNAKKIATKEKQVKNV